MADTKKVVLENVKKGSGQSTYVLVKGSLGKAGLEDYLESANIPYNKVYVGGGKVYVKIPSTAARIE